MAEDTLYNAMLLDFYGPLLTEKQREYFDLHYNSDYSLTEIAEDSGVSRQAVWDNITRARRTIEKTCEAFAHALRFEPLLDGGQIVLTEQTGEPVDLLLLGNVEEQRLLLNGIMSFQETAVAVSHPPALRMTGRVG